MLIDTHCHLDDKKFSINKQKEIINNLKENNLEKIITVGASKESSINAVNLASVYENVYASVGVHPEFATNDLDFLYTLAKNQKVVAIGEIGLDYYYTVDNKEVQKECFISQLKIANKLKLPVVIHLRDAYEDMLKILKENKTLLENGFVVHCYSGSLEYAKELLKLGAYLSFTGVITFKNAKKSIEVLKEIPLDKIMIETDSPYLAPEPFRGKLNEPKNVNFVFDKICEIRNLKKEELEQILRKNTRKFYKI